MKTRLIKVVATARREGILWKASTACAEGSSWHRAEWEIARVTGEADAGLPSADSSTIRARRPEALCERCSAALADAVEVSPFSSTGPVYDTPSSKPEPGSMFWATWYTCAEGGTCFYRWANCKGDHLIVVLPNGHQWDINSRASNCTMREDGLHRCWVRHGDPEKGEPVHVDKSGVTCAAGAGSIGVPGYHGFLHNGELTSC